MLPVNDPSVGYVAPTVSTTQPPVMPGSPMPSGLFSTNYFNPMTGGDFPTIPFGPTTTPFNTGVERSPDFLPVVPGTGGPNFPVQQTVSPQQTGAYNSALRQNRLNRFGIPSFASALSAAYRPQPFNFYASPSGRFQNSRIFNFLSGNFGMPR